MMYHVERTSLQYVPYLSLLIIKATALFSSFTIKSTIDVAFLETCSKFTFSHFFCYSKLVPQTSLSL